MDNQSKLLSNDPNGSNRDDCLGNPQTGIPEADRKEHLKEHLTFF